MVAALVRWYERDLARIQDNHDKLLSLDVALLTELDLSVRAVIDVLKNKLDCLKDQYWAELFSHMGAVTSKLTAKYRRAITEHIGGFKAVDFSAENIYAILLWVLEHANKYIEKQTLEVFDAMLSRANIRNYKSNQRVFGDGDWRYGQRPENISHVSLDYRIVLEHSGGISRNYSGKPHMAKHAAEFLGDLLTLANLLRFPADMEDARLHEGLYPEQSAWKPGKPQLFQDISGHDLIEVRAFLNGNMHIRLAQRFALAINVAVGKLRGWIRTKDEAVSEFGDEAAALYDVPLLLGSASMPYLAMSVA